MAESSRSLPSWRWWFVAAAVAFTVAAQACSGAALGEVRAVAKTTAPLLSLSGAKAGVIDMLTYNVAGLPAFVSPSDPERTLPLVSPLLNAYDLVFAQEDFAYHEQLVADAGHRYQFEPKPADSAFVGNGLATLSNYPLDEVIHVPWESCNGYLTALSDCLGEKGFSVGLMHVSRGVSFDVYNIHADAGTDPEDIAARRSEYEQLAMYVQRHSAGRAILLAGDTNLDGADPEDRAILRGFMAKTGLSDSCQQVICASDEIDRVFVRSSDRVDLRAIHWFEDTRFVDERGHKLSDHPAVAVRIAWSVR